MINAKNLLRHLTPKQASRYIELREMLNKHELGLLWTDGDLNDELTRCTLDSFIPAKEALELLSLHDLLYAPDFNEYEDTKRTSVQDMKAVR